MLCIFPLLQRGMHSKSARGDAKKGTLGGDERSSTSGDPPPPGKPAVLHSQACGSQIALQPSALLNHNCKHPRRRYICFAFWGGVNTVFQDAWSTGGVLFLVSTGLSPSLPVVTNKHHRGFCGAKDSPRSPPGTNCSAVSI